MRGPTVCQSPIRVIKHRRTREVGQAGDWSGCERYVQKMSVTSNRFKKATYIHIRSFLQHLHGIFTSLSVTSIAYNIPRTRNYRRRQSLKQSLNTQLLSWSTGEIFYWFSATSYFTVNPVSMLYFSQLTYDIKCAIKVINDWFPFPLEQYSIHLDCSK